MVPDKNVSHSRPAFELHCIVLRSEDVWYALGTDRHQRLFLTF
jgi:hypothetical protein